MATSTRSIVPPPGSGASSSASISASELIGELVAVGVEELDAVVLRRVVRGRDHDAEIEREERHGRSRAARRPAPHSHRRPRRLGQTPLPAPAPTPGCRGRRRRGPGRSRAPKPCRAARRARRSDPPRRPREHRPCRRSGDPPTRSYRLENWGALRALCSPAFLRSTWRASRVRKPSRLSGIRSSGSASTSARAIPWRTAPA